MNACSNPPLVRRVNSGVTAETLRHERCQLAVRTSVSVTQRAARSLSETKRQRDEVGRGFDKRSACKMCELVHDPHHAAVRRWRQLVLGHPGDLMLDEDTVKAVRAENGRGRCR
jgi:hypothetical protein